MVAAARDEEPETLRRLVFAVFGADAAAAFTQALASFQS
jgi:hypothetical protein